MTIHLSWHGPFRVDPKASGRPRERARAIVGEELADKRGVYVFSAEKRIQPWTRYVRYVGKTSGQTFLDRIEQHIREPYSASDGSGDNVTNASFNNGELWVAEQEKLVVTVWLGEILNELDDAGGEIEQVERAYIYLLGAKNNQITLDGPNRLTTVINSARNGQQGVFSGFTWSPSALPHLMNVYPKAKTNSWAECFFPSNNNLNSIRRRYSVSRGSLWNRKYSEERPLADKV